jgi:hypothetical protein
MARRNHEFQTIRSEGGLLPADLLRRVLDPREGLAGTSPEDYGLAPGDRLNENITQSWNRLLRHWKEFRATAAQLPEGEAGTGVTNDRWNLPLLRELNYGLLPAGSGPEIGGRTYAISRFFGPVPIHLIGCGLSLDHRVRGQRGAATANPHGLVQDFLNRSDDHLWALLSNGLKLRLLRDNQALSRQSFLEFDLEAMMDGEVFSDFVLLWLTTHATRLNPREEQRPDSCWLEQWTKEAEEQGTRALGDLRGGVQRALQVLGEGFTSHPRNMELRDALRTGTLGPGELHAQLLRVVYRLIFLFVAEDRVLEGRPLLHPPGDTDEARLARERYAAHYSTGRLREMAGRIKGSRHGDLWRQLQLLVGALSGASEQETVRGHLALPGLGSFLWDPASTAALNDAELTNHDLLEALRNLAFTRPDRVLRPVDYKNLGAEELGGVYESLLALTPQVSGDGGRFTFAEFAGNERKTSGSYYTPDALVQCLLDSALDPVVAAAIDGKSGDDAARAILSLRVCDPAAGSGHFLVGAAHRLARHLARARALADGQGEPSPLDYQHALREVIGHCLYGVDVNPMAAELCRVSLWLEAMEPGKALTFLDHHIRVGNSLLGSTPELIAAGLPDDAFKAIEGDDRKACTVLRKRSKSEREGIGGLFKQSDAVSLGRLAKASAALEDLPGDRPEEIQAKEHAFRQHEESEEYSQKKALADVWCAAFMIRKYFREPGREASASGITQKHLRESASGTELRQDLAGEVERLADEYQFFHWHLSFPEVFAHGGFDCVIGNPPWQALSPDRAQFFGYYVDSFRAKSQSEQEAEIAQVLSDPLASAAWGEYCRSLYASVHFMKSSGVYRRFASGNLGKGDFNVYRMFIELALDCGKVAAQVVPGAFATGANASAIRKELLLSGRLETLFVFDNIRRQWFDVSVNSVCLYVAARRSTQGQFLAAFQLENASDLQELDSRKVALNHEDVVAQSPEVFSIPSVRDQFDADLTSKLYAGAPRFGAQTGRYPYRHLMAEIHMGSGRGRFSDGGTGLPVYEGRMIDQYDYRAKQYVAGRGSSSRWNAAIWGSRNKEIAPQWHVPPDRVPDKLGDRCTRYRIGWGDIADPSMQRSVVTTLIPPGAICGHKVPTITAPPGAEWVYLCWLAILNSTVIDFIARKQLASKTLTMTILDSLPVPRLEAESSHFRLIAEPVVRLMCTGAEMDGFRAHLAEQLPGDLKDLSEAEAELSEPVRANLRSSVDAVVAKRLFRISRAEYEFILDSFGVLERQETGVFGEFRFKRLCLEAFDHRGAGSSACGE